MARTKSPAADPGTVRLVPSSSSFDFLEGAFAASQRARKLGLAITVAAVATLTVLAMMGFGGLLSKQSAQTNLDKTVAMNNEALAKLAKIDNAGGLSADALTAHVNERNVSLKKAIGTEIDVVKFTKSLRASAPAGVEITSIIFHDAAAGVANATSTTGASTGTSGSTDTSGSSTTSGTGTDTAAASTLGTIEVKGTVSNFALIGAWAQSVSRVPGLSGVNPTWTGGGTAIATTLTATINKAGLTARSQDLAAGKRN